MKYIIYVFVFDGDDSTKKKKKTKKCSLTLALDTLWTLFRSPSIILFVNKK